jgi:hypothetical protein
MLHAGMLRILQYSCDRAWKEANTILANKIQHEDASAHDSERLTDLFDIGIMSKASERVERSTSRVISVSMVSPTGD